MTIPTAPLEAVQQDAKTGATDNSQFGRKALRAKIERLEASNKVLRDALGFCEDLLGFHEGSEEPTHEGGKPCIWINAEGDNGDLQQMLRIARRALQTGTGQ